MRAEPIEIVFALISIVGASFSFANVLGSRRDLAIFRGSKANSIGEAILTAALHSEIARLTGFTFLAIVGVWASIESQIPRVSGAGHTAYRVFASLALILANCVWAFNTYLSWRLRRKLRELKRAPAGATPANRRAAFRSFTRYRRRDKSEEVEQALFDKAEQTIADDEAKEEEAP